MASSTLTLRLGGLHRFPAGDCLIFCANAPVWRHLCLCYCGQLKLALSHPKRRIAESERKKEGGGVMFRFPLTKQPQTSREPFSVETLAKASRLRGATVTQGICPYCAVGCGQL